VSVLQSLKWIFWGVLIVAVPVQFKGYDLRVLGYAIIAVGMIGLVKNPVGGRHSMLMRLVATVVLLDAFWTPFAEGASRMPGVEKIASVTFSILNIFATIGFCIAMRRLCGAIPLERAKRSWQMSIMLWYIGLPASVGVTCLSMWAVRDENGVISPNSTPLYSMIPLFALFLITLIVWLCSLFSLWRTIAGLKGMVKRLPAADDFGLARRPSFQFSIRALMIVIAAAAVIAAGFSQGTIPYWQFTMAGLVGLSLSATWLDHRMLSKGLLIVVGVVLLGGYTQIAHHGASGGIGGLVVRTVDSAADHPSSLPPLADIEAWLASRGFQRSAPPPVVSIGGLVGGLHPSQGTTAIWFGGKTANSGQLDISVEYWPIDQHLLQVQVNYTWRLDDFPWVVHEHERQVRQFANEMAEWLKQYDEGPQESHSKQ